MKDITGVLCDFKIGFKDPIEQLIDRAKKAIVSAGGEFIGTIFNGTYSIPTDLGSVIGTYLVQGKVINFKITEKPLLVSCKRIESEIRKYLGNSLRTKSSALSSRATLYTGPRGGKYYFNSSGRKTYIKD